jgi:hypothetical protein
MATKAEARRHHVALLGAGAHHIEAPGIHRHIGQAPRLVTQSAMVRACAMGMHVDARSPPGR